MVDGISNSTGALGALRNLQSATRDVEASQARIGSGLAVRTARDNPVAFQASEALRSDEGGLHIVANSLGRAGAISDIAVAAAEQVSKLVTDLRSTASRAQTPDLTQSQRDIYAAEFRETFKQIEAFVRNAQFDNANLLDGSLPQGVSFVADADATETLTLAGRNLLPGGGVVTLTESNDVSTVEGAEAAARAADDTLANLGRELTELGNENRRVNAQVGFVTRFADALASGVGRLVDADLTAESALIQALQVKQSLSIESLSVVNRAPQALLSLLRS